MDTTVTGLFSGRDRASAATLRLLGLGFRPEQIRVVNADTPDRHEAIHEQVADTKRAVRFGLVFGPVAGGIAGGALFGVFGSWSSFGVGCLVGLVGGAILGTLVGRTTTTQVKDEIEHQVDAGTVLVTVTTDSANARPALDLLAAEGATGIVATATSYTGGVLPADPRQGAEPGSPSNSAVG